jgi:chromosome segregation ATPase
MFDGLDSMDFASGGLGLVGLIVSSIVYLKSQHLRADVDHETVATEQLQTIFDGYGGIVEALQEELDRLKLTIEELRLEQDACEKRNGMLSIEILELHHRIATLEKRRG